MGWGSCGEDSKGRPIGYMHDAKCDHPDCNKTIDRGLSHACGGMHGNTEYGCEKYFCEDHMSNVIKCCDGDYVRVCDECAKTLIDGGEMYLDEDEGVIAHVKGD
ncbi:MAG: hypothetical protein ACRDC6_06240 [Shewanella sp.]